MAYIYQADIYCDDCGRALKSQIVKEIKSKGLDLERNDSDEFPQSCGDDEESDCPQHCGNHENCLNAEVLPDGTKIGCLIGTSLTTDGIEYVKEAVREGGLVAEFWKEQFDYIDFDEEDDEDLRRDEKRGLYCEHEDISN